MKKIFNSLFFCGSFLITKAQSLQHIQTNETNITGNYSLLTDVSNVEITNKSLDMERIKTYTKNQWQLGLNFANQSRRFFDMQESYLFDDFENSFFIGVNSKYRTKLPNNWSTSINFNSQISSTLERSLTNHDIVLAGSFKTQKKWLTSNLERKGELSLGLYYDTLFGKPSLYPYVSYMHFISTTWNYTLGFPFSGLGYTINAYQNIDLQVGPKGNYTNNSGVITLNGSDSYINSKLEFTALAIDINYKAKLDTNWIVDFGISYLPNTELKILDHNDDEIYAFAASESLNINFGIKYKLN